MGVGAQGITFVLAPTVLIVAIAVLAAGQDGHFMSWAVFAALIITGTATALQAARIGRLGGGHLLITTVTPNFIAVSVLAMAEGGPALLASLVVLTSLFYLGMAAWLPLLRRIITPVVSGTVLMLIAAMVLPIAFDRMKEVPEGATAAAGPCVAVVTLVVTTMLMLRAPRIWRPWSLLIGIAAGCLAAVPFGLYNFERLTAAAWVGIPASGFPGLDLAPTAAFWGLLPMFLIVALVQLIKSIGDAMVAQQVSRRRSRATDFRLIQGSIYANGVGILLSGLAGTPPTTSYSSLTVSLINLTGVAARSVGYAMGGFLVVLAFFPKLTSVLLIIPSAVMGGFLVIALGMLFVEGIQTLVRAGLDPQKAMVVGLAFSIGLGMQHQNLLKDLLGSPWGMLLGNGITVGTATAIALTAFLEWTRPRRRRLEVRLDIADLPRIDSFLQEVAARMGWDAAAAGRLRSAGEETLASLLQPSDQFQDGERPRLILATRPETEAVELEFLAVFDEENLEDRLAYLNQQTETLDERDLSFRLLRHYASSVRHQKYHGLDVVTVRVNR
jgi:xanthine/uracil permease